MPHPAGPRAGANVSILNHQCAAGVNARPTKPENCRGQPGNCGPALQQTPVGDDACIVPHTPRHRKRPGRDLRPKSRRCAAVGLRNAPAGAVNPAPTNKFCASGQTGTAATHPDDRRAGCPHPAAPRGGANAPGGYGIRPYGRRRTPRRRKHLRNGRDRPPPPHHPAPLHKGAFLSLFYKNAALYLSHLRGGAAIRQNFTTFRRRAGFSRQAIHGMIDPCIPP